MRRQHLLLREKRRKAHYDEVFKSDTGRRVLSDLAAANYVYATAFVPGDPYMSAFREGRRAVVIDLINYSDTSIEELMKIYGEQRSNDNS